MYNWSTDEQALVQNEEKHIIWKLEQMVNFGLGKEKIDRTVLIKYFHALDIDPQRRKFLNFLLYGKLDSH